MIVISHPWEFVPKGSSHLNYHGKDIKTESKSNQFNANVIQNGGEKKADGYGQAFNTNQPKGILIVHPEDSSLNESSFAYFHKSPSINQINLEQNERKEKWHLKQINEYCETEIFIRENKVVVSYGSDNDSKVVKRSFTFDSPIIDSNWFNFKTDSNDEGLIRDSLCIFETQKVHIYFQNGSDFHIQLPFKVSNFWKLKDGILFERQIDNPNKYRTNQQIQTLFTLSNPLDELKPICVKSASGEISRASFWRENSKQTIVDVVENFNLVLVFNRSNNAHYIYRIVEYYSEDSQAVNNLLNATQMCEASDSLNANPPTPMERTESGTCLSLAVGHSKKRLSVSPIISTFSFYNKLSSPAPANTQHNTTIYSTNVTSANGMSSTAIQSTTATANPVNPNIISVHQHYFQRNFSPMAAVSRSPTCSSSPTMLSSVRRNSCLNNQTLGMGQANITTTTLLSRTTNLQVVNSNQSNSTFMTPSIEVNNFPYSHYRTPANQQNTPINNYRRHITPQFNNSIINPILNTESVTEQVYEQIAPEYCLELVWNEPMIASNDASFNEKALKFFYINDLYNQKYVCYLVYSKSQLRCVKVDYNAESDLATPCGLINYIPAKDAVFIENRNLMITIDSFGSLFVYSGLIKLCKLQLHNIIWSSNLQPPAISAPSNKQPLCALNTDFSPIVTPIKLTRPPHVDNLEEQQNNLFKTPKCEPLKSTSSKNLLQQQHEFRSVMDATGSRFSVKFNDNRLVRVNLSESSTCKLVNVCLEAFKYTLNKEIYYELIQQWFIHRYTISGESIRDQLNIFLCLLLNLCGCFDLSKLENVLPFLSMNFLTKTSNLSKKKQEATNETNEDESEKSDKSKRVKSNSEGVDGDWEFLINDDFLDQMAGNERNLSEFDYASLRASTRKDPKSELRKSDMLESAPSEMSESILLGSRQKRPINTTHMNASMTTNAASSTTGTQPQSGGILYPYLRHILYTLHLIYEESKLYRSLQVYCDSLLQMQYLLANELNLQHYMTYYEHECPHLLKLKSLKVFTPHLSHSSSSSSLPARNTSNIAHIINQEPPVLHTFLMKLIDRKSDMIFINPFPIIGQVTDRIIKTIKIYALIALCTKSQLKNTNFNEFCNQLFFKVNFSGFMPQTSEQNLNKSQVQPQQASTSTSSTSQQPQQQPNEQSQFLNTNNNSLKFTFKAGEKYIYENIFSLCLEMGLSTLNEIYDYPFAVLFPILEAIHWSRENPCFSWPSYAFDLIGRNDLAILKVNSDSINAESTLTQFLNDSEFNSTSKPNDKSQSINSRRFFINKSNENDENLVLNVSQNAKKEDEDGMQHVMQLESLKCRFNEDLRIKEVRNCLQSTRPIQIKLVQGPDVSDHDFVEEEERFLLCICTRTMSLPVARGIFTLHTINPIPTEPVILPELNLKGKSVTKKTTIDLTRIEVPANMTYWPLFHNGVAAGLTIHAQATDLSNAWIKSHLARNFELTNEQAGFLYGLGLTGHLANFSMLNVHDALTRRHDLTNIAILLGLAASKIGSMDLSVTRLISMHIKSLMPPVEIELEIPYNIQIAALMSLGLVYFKSANKHISYVLLKEIGRLPGNEIEKDLHSLDREAYSLTAGFSLGMILLEKGKKSLTIMDPTFTDELYHYMVGGHKDNTNQATNPNVPGTNDQGINNFRTVTNSYIREGESINTNVTCPGATVALGLIYFNSCDKLISEWFAPPDSAFLLDSIRPDFLLLRTVSRNLIMWKHVLPTQAWLLSQLSNLLKTNIKSDKILNQHFAHLILEPAKPKTKSEYVKITKRQSTLKSSKTVYPDDPNSEFEEEEEDDDDDDDEFVELNDDTDDEDNIVIKQTNKIKQKKNKSSKHLLGDLIQFDDVVDDDFFLEDDVVKKKNGAKSSRNEMNEQEDEDYEELDPNIDINSDSCDSNNIIDEETKTEAFRHIIAGACMSIGLKFAGSFNKNAYETLLFWAKYFTELKDNRLSTENCLCVIVLSLAMVMAGSGDLEVLRICRYLRSRVGPNVTHVLYGSHMAVNMALGLLFMAGGRYTLKTDPMSVALMLCAFYPQFPVDSNDNRFHLQAFRHLYVLASEPRLILSKDVDTNEFCYVPLEIVLKANEHHDVFKYQQMAPCILPELNRIQELRILGPRYYPIRFKDNLHFNDLKNILLSELLVKQKNGYFRYSEDPKYYKAFNIRNILNKVIIPHKITPNLLEQITNEEHINLFAKMLNKSSENRLNTKTNRLLKIIYESVVQETFDFVGVMLLLEKEANNEPKSIFIQQMKLVESFYKSLSTNTNHIINQEFLFVNMNNLESKLRNKLKDRRDLIKSYLSGNFVDEIEYFVYYCILNDINKSEIEAFSNNGNDFLALLNVPKSGNLKFENLLKLLNLFK